MVFLCCSLGQEFCETLGVLDFLTRKLSCPCESEIVEKVYFNYIDIITQMHNNSGV